MILIAHRALFDGPDLQWENHPEQVVRALGEGYDAEIDVWWTNGSWWLGHDTQSYEVEEAFLQQKGLWLHCKNVEALTRLLALKTNCFWHQNDHYTVTAGGFIWAYPGEALTERSIWVQPEWFEGWHKDLGQVCAGVCSKFVGEIRSNHPGVYDPHPIQRDRPIHVREPESSVGHVEPFEPMGYDSGITEPALGEETGPLRP